MRKEVKLSQITRTTYEKSTDQDNIGYPLFSSIIDYFESNPGTLDFTLFGSRAWGKSYHSASDYDFFCSRVNYEMLIAFLDRNDIKYRKSEYYMTGIFIDTLLTSNSNQLHTINVCAVKSDDLPAWKCANAMMKEMKAPFVKNKLTRQMVFETLCAILTHGIN